MAKKSRPIYICNKCQKETLDPTEVRQIIGTIKDGENHLFITKDDESVYDKIAPNTEIMNNMYCIDCLKIILFLDHPKYETPTQQMNIQDIIKIIPPETKTNTPTTRSITIDPKPEIKVTQTTEQSDVPNELEKESQSNPTFLNKLAEATQKENIVVEQNSTTGKYIVLGKILDPSYENYAAEFFGITSVDELRNSYGGSLIGVFISTGNCLDEIPNDCMDRDIIYINRVFMGIPNVLETVCMTSSDGNFAYMLVDEFNQMYDIKED